jgi:hypothetical protein
MIMVFNKGKGILIMVAFFWLHSFLLSQTLYVIADINASGNIPLQAYDIDGTGLVFQAEYPIPDHEDGPVGIAVDPVNKFLFITYEESYVIYLVDAQTMLGAGTVSAGSADDLAGIVYNNENMQLYAVDRNTPTLFSYLWIPENKVLQWQQTITLQNTRAFGISLDELNQRLFVANNDTLINVFDVNTWELVDEIIPEHGSTNIAIDQINQVLYSGGKFTGSDYIEKIDLSDKSTESVYLGQGIGVMGIVVNQGTGLVYVSTGFDSSGDNLQVFNSQLEKLYSSERIGDPTGIATGAAYNPMNFNILNIPDCNFPGDTVTAELIYFNGLDQTLTNVEVLIDIPEGSTFVSASNNGNYNGIENRVSWYIGSVPPSTTPYYLYITIKIDGDFFGNSIMLAKIMGSMGQTSVGKTFAVIEDFQPEIFGDEYVCENVIHTYSTEFQDYYNYTWHINNGTITGGAINNEVQVKWQGADQGELYVEVGINNTDCDKTSDPFIVDITPGPENQISGPDIVCLGDTIIYTSDDHAGNSYHWTVTSGTASLLSGILENELKMIWKDNGAATLELTETDVLTDCPAIFGYDVFVASYPEIDLGATDTIICPMDTLTLYAGTGSEQVLWSSGETTNSIKIGTSGIGVTSKMISVLVENEYGCISTDSIHVIFDFSACTGIDDHPAMKYFNFFPNPVSGDCLQISSRLPIDNVSISIYDLIGSLKYFSKPGDIMFEENIDISTYSPGIYFISFKSDTFNGTVKLLIH